MYSFFDYAVEDEKYAYSVGRIRALENYLLDRQKFERMADALGVDEITRQLSDTSYAKYFGEIAMPYGYEDMLKRERWDTYKTVDGLLIDKQIYERIVSVFDFYNIKVLLKGKIMEKNTDAYLIPLSNIPIEDIKVVFQNEYYESLPEYLATAVNAGIEAYYEKKDSQRLSFAIDRIMYKYLCGVDYPFLRIYFKMNADIINIYTIFRLKFTGRGSNLSKVFLEGGYIPSEEIVKVFSENIDTIAGFYSRTSYQQIVNEGILGFREENSFVKLERAGEKFMDDFLKTTRYISLGAEPVIAYLFFKEKEIKNIRMLFVAKLNKMESDIIKGRLVI